jgi:hypothetical protein
MKNPHWQENIQKEEEEGSRIDELRFSIYDEDVNLIKNMFTITVEKQKIKYIKLCNNKTHLTGNIGT